MKRDSRFIENSSLSECSYLPQSEWSVMALREETVDIGLGVPVFVTVAGVAQEAVVAETFQIAIFYTEESHQCFVVVDTVCLV